MEETIRRLIGWSASRGRRGGSLARTAEKMRDRRDEKEDVDGEGKRALANGPSGPRHLVPGRSLRWPAGCIRKKRLELSEKRTVQRVPSPVIMEISYGATFGGEDERRNVRNALRTYPVVQQDETIAHRAGQLLAQADLAAGGESSIDKVDPMVAAVADHYDEPVLTATGDDFRGARSRGEDVPRRGELMSRAWRDPPEVTRTTHHAEMG